MSLKTSTFSIITDTGEMLTSGLVTYPANYTKTERVEITSGTANKFATISATVDGTGTTYDLTALAGNPGQATINISAVKYLKIYNSHATNSLVVGGAASNAFTGFWSGTITIPPGGYAVFMDSDGAATSGSSKSLKVASSSTSTTFELVIVGAAT